jgi:small subunit ribosomal protein S6
MRRYELMVILDPDLEERTVAPSLETYLKIIKESGGRQARYLGPSPYGI